MTDSPAVIAHAQLYALAREITESSPIELRLQLGLLAAQVEIAGRLKGLEATLDAGLKVHTE
ncbi:hypothetical protein ACIBI7_53650 [Nonomuraea fuscirosea]|uniref:hypothetical protein n=1 Tax=Nonomuraea fuscirosea TaxID=1291556 RepID=UPI0037B7D7D8